MFHPVILGVIGGALVAKMVLRRRYARAGGCAGGMAEGGRHWRRGRGLARWTAPAPAVQLATLIGSLELNARQKEEFDEVLATVRNAVGVEKIDAWPGLGKALRVAGTEPFDRAELAELPEDAVDGLEHLHNILTPEQRERLAAPKR